MKMETASFPEETAKREEREMVSRTHMKKQAAASTRVALKDGVSTRCATLHSER